jgi:hypothetical protein
MAEVGALPRWRHCASLSGTLLRPVSPPRGFAPQTSARAGGPLDQGQQGTCVVYAIVAVMAQLLTLKYGILLHVENAINTIKRAAGALEGAEVVAVIESLHRLGREQKLDNLAKDRVLQLQVHHSGYMNDFDALCKHMVEYQGRGAQAVVLVKTGESGHQRHAVAAEGLCELADGTKAVQCLNSWGSNTPYFDVVSGGARAGERVPYIGHVLIKDVDIVRMKRFIDARLEIVDPPRVLPRHDARPLPLQAKDRQITAYKQASEQLKHGFQVTGCAIEQLNVKYELRGELDGFPLYRAIDGGAPGLYYNTRHSMWYLHAAYSEAAAQNPNYCACIAPKDGAIPLGQGAWMCSVDGRFSTTSLSQAPSMLTIAALSAAENPLLMQECAEMRHEQQQQPEEAEPSDAFSVGEIIQCPGCQRGCLAPQRAKALRCANCQMIIRPGDVDRSLVWRIQD